VVTATSTGDAPVTITAVAVTGDPAFSVVPGAGGCTVRVRFAPSSVGSIFGQLAVSSDVQASPPDTDPVVGSNPDVGSVAVRTDDDGRFTTRLLVQYRDGVGPRDVVAAGDGYRVTTAFLVVPGTAQPKDVVTRR
jgi:hypothetical protein